MSGWRPIETAPIGMQLLVWEPMYGWLIASMSSFDGKWRLKSSGNYWMDCPKVVEFTKWMPLPEGPRPDTENPAALER